MKAIPLNTSHCPSDGQATSLNHTQGRTQICKAVFDGEADCRGRKMEQNSQDKGRGEGRYTSARWHRLLCNWAPKLFIHQPPCPPFFLPKLHCYWSGLLDWRHSSGICMHRGSTDMDFGGWNFVPLFNTLNSWIQSWSKGCVFPHISFLSGWKFLLLVQHGHHGTLQVSTESKTNWILIYPSNHPPKQRLDYDDILDGRLDQFVHYQRFFQTIYTIVDIP